MENSLKSQLFKKSAIVADNYRVVLAGFERFEEDLSFDDFSIKEGSHPTLA